MFNTIITKYKDPNNPSLGILIYLLKFFGIWPYGRAKYFTIIFKLIYFYLILIFLNTSVNTIVQLNYHMFANFIQYSALHLSIIKIYNLTERHKMWRKLFVQISEMDNESVTCADSKSVTVILRYRQYSILIGLGFMCIGIVLNIIFISMFWFNNIIKIDLTKLDEKKLITMNILNPWLPFDETNKQGRWISGIIQSIYIEFTALYLLCWDSLVMSIMLLLAGHLKALKVRCECALDNPDANDNIQFNNIVNCHKQYMKIQKYVFVILLYNYVLYLTICRN